MAAASEALVLAAGRTTKVPLASETKKAYWWNTPRSRGLTWTSVAVAAAARRPPDAVDRTRRSMGIREDSGFGEASGASHAVKRPRPAGSNWTPLSTHQEAARTLLVLCFNALQRPP